MARHSFLSRLTFFGTCSASLLVPGAPLAPAPALAAGDHRPAVFSELDFDQALARTRGTNRILVAMFSADWCLPCKGMENSVWPDPRVSDWVRANGIAVLVDVARQSDIAVRYGVQSMPTFIAFRDDQPIDRTTGARSTEAFLGWLGRLGSGDRDTGAPTALTPTTSSPTPITPAPPAVRIDTAPIVPPPQHPAVITPPITGTPLQQARALAAAGRADDAAAAFAAIIESGSGEISAPLVGSELQDLVRRNSSARATVLAARDRVQARLADQRQSGPRMTAWLELNAAGADEYRITKWFDRVRTDSAGRAAVSDNLPVVVSSLGAKGRFTDAAAIVPDGPELARSAYSSLGHATGPGRAPALDQFRRTVSSAYAGLLAAGRDSDAAATAAEAVRLDDSSWTRIMLVSRALDARQARPDQARLLDEAAAKGANITAHRKRLDSMLSPRPR